jgi:hypothetical protein
MHALPPKHLARREHGSGLAPYREHVFESLTAIAVVLVVATFLANRADRAGSNTAAHEQGSGRDATSTTVSRPPGAFGNLAANWSFEENLTGWQVIGAVDTSREPQGRTSGSCVSLRARGPQPGRVGLRQAGVIADAAKGSRYVASAWVRSTAPAQRVTIRLVGSGGAAEGSEAEAMTLPGLAWRRVVVGHTVAKAGMDLDVEVTADGVPAGDALLVDEVLVRQGI